MEIVQTNQITLQYNIVARLLAEQHATYKWQNFYSFNAKCLVGQGNLNCRESYDK